MRGSSDAAPNLSEECVTESSLLLPVVQSAVIPLALGQRVERNDHSRIPCQLRTALRACTRRRRLQAEVRRFRAVRE